ncbi:MAG: 7-cyano-7-deazaguanine synthase QueC [Candidatus Latescibacterota bacterium]|nr:7-cyano-7-deazaguanine synthase QueC [Candidatus Latescibacterota bacterium]
MQKAVVLLSGGLDSCVTASVAAQEHELALLHLQYGQRTQTRERQAFDDIADHFNIAKANRLVVETEFLSQIGCSALTDASIKVPDADFESTNVPITYVPFRNAHLLSLGVSWAETIGAHSVYIGVVQDDSSGYPDCTEKFCSTFGQAVTEGTREGKIEIRTPVIHHDKAGIVKLALETEAPLHLTWSCYANEITACGMCDSCVLRLRAFAKCGAIDPIPYAKQRGRHRLQRLPRDSTTG